MPQMPVQLDEWRPDLALLDNKFSADVENVFVGLNSYMPIPSLFPIGTAALPGKCLGLCAYRDSASKWHIYAGTATNLYEWDNVLGWVDRSRTAGGAYNVPVGERWSFAQFGDYLAAVQIGDVPQRINMKTDSNFVAMPGSPPIAHTVAQLGDFLILCNLIEAGVPNERKIIWCGINDTSNWTVGINLCDEQEFPDGGAVRGVAGGEIGYVVQDRAIRLMQFLPNDSTTIFSFTRVVTERGAVGEWCFCCVANVLYFWSSEGFYALSGAQLNPIGSEKVNEWAKKNTDPGRQYLAQAMATSKPWIAFVCYSNSAVDLFDTVILYNWTLDKWTRMKELAQSWASIGVTPPLDLDTDGGEPGDPDLDSNAQPLDSFLYQGGLPQVIAIDVNGVLATLDGPNLQATMVTAEMHLVPGQRAFVSEVYPLIDAQDLVVEVGTRERLQDDVEWHAPVPLEIVGCCTVLTSARLHRFRFTIPRGDEWTHAQGALADAQQDGEKA